MKFRNFHVLPVLAAALVFAAPAFSNEPPKDAKPPAEAPEKEEKKEKAEPAGGHVFAWPFADWKSMRPRGGSTQGSEVTLRTEPKEAWTRLRENGLQKFEQDRRAILALAGNYRASFDFVETLGFSENYKPPRPYFSWGTENVTVLEDKGEFISLQHTLVMYFKNDKGEVEGPMIMKHWRQDWTWQPAELHVFEGNDTWARVKAENSSGRWSQAVYQVDDSPRYEVLGLWAHEGGLSTWRSDNCRRPLPRREFSVRKDYNVLDGFHEITLTPTGWVHVQNNSKLQLDKDGTRHYVGMELGVNRYEEITAPELAKPFNDYWKKTGAYWEDVRRTWAGVFQDNDRFEFKDSIDDEKLFSIHFGYAAELEEKEGDAKYDPAAGLKHARETIGRFLVLPAKKSDP